ncbi:MAG TPA: copper resistance protein CopZ [Clostridiales bacterium]|nr:MAG: hypothetical protein A2Y18_03300 [Clostridiales bacterium GWD2_32_19]HCC08150.1 copper resistance protein CopZ [Clostridiales bacterium]
MDKVVINVEGMSCNHCENSVIKAISGLNGVNEVSASAANKTVVVEYDSTKVTNDDIKGAILQQGYDVIEEKGTYKE